MYRSNRPTDGPKPSRRKLPLSPDSEANGAGEGTVPPQAGGQGQVPAAQGGQLPNPNGMPGKPTIQRNVRPSLGGPQAPAQGQPIQNQPIQSQPVQNQPGQSQPVKPSPGQNQGLPAGYPQAGSLPQGARGPIGAGPQAGMPQPGAGQANPGAASPGLSMGNMPSVAPPQPGVQSHPGAAAATAPAQTAQAAQISNNPAGLPALPNMPAAANAPNANGQVEPQAALPDRRPGTPSSAGSSSIAKELSNTSFFRQEEQVRKSQETSRRSPEQANAMHKGASGSAQAGSKTRPADVKSPATVKSSVRMPQSGGSPRQQLEQWISAMVKNGASDLILRAGGRPSIRVDGRIGFLEGRVPGPGPFLEVLDGIVGRKRMEEWRESGSVDAALSLDGLGRFRLNAYKQMGEPALVMRRVADNPPDLVNLHLPTQSLQGLSKRKRGLILVTGVAGSGKSTTLSGIIEHMNRNLDRHVVTLEDPVEVLFSEKRCVISQREVGVDCPNFHEGLRHALRQSPDVILIGEMRDPSTVMAALDAAETGHLVMSTMHTVNAPQTLDRILGFFPAERHAQVRMRLADNLSAVLSQRLIPRVSGKGLVPAVELLISTPHIRELLSEGQTPEIGRVIESAGEKGLISFNQSLKDMVEKGVIDVSSALEASDRPDELVMGLRGITSGTDRADRNGTPTAAQPPKTVEPQADGALRMRPGQKRPD